MNKVIDTGGYVITLQGNLTKSTTYKSLITRTITYFWAINLVICSAGGLTKRKPIARTADVTDELFLKVIDLNSFSALMATT